MIHKPQNVCCLLWKSFPSPEPHLTSQVRKAWSCSRMSQIPGRTALPDPLSSAPVTMTGFSLSREARRQGPGDTGDTLPLTQHLLTIPWEAQDHQPSKCPCLASNTVVSLLLLLPPESQRLTNIQSACYYKSAHTSYWLWKLIYLIYSLSISKKFKKREKNNSLCKLSLCFENIWWVTVWIINK